jgi:hypothetical protein
MILQSQQERKDLPSGGNATHDLSGKEALAVSRGLFTAATMCQRRPRPARHQGTVRPLTCISDAPERSYGQRSSGRSRNGLYAVSGRMARKSHGLLRQLTKTVIETAERGDDRAPGL